MDPSQLPEKVWYFAYGSNISPDRLKGRIATTSAKLFTEKIVILPDYKILFNKISWSHADTGYANIVPSPGDHVCGVAYSMSPEGITALDHFEKTPSNYFRGEVEVHTYDESKSEALGESLKAQAYFAVPEQTREGLKPTKEYMSHICARKLEMPGYYQCELESVDAHDFEFIGNHLTNYPDSDIPTPQK